MTETLIAPSVDTLEDEKLALAQRSINLPDVQEMLKRLSAYNLGIYMPHIHDEEGSFHALPVGVVQVEDDLTVSFRTEEEIAQAPPMVPVAWTWEENNFKVGAMCRSFCWVVNEGWNPVHRRLHNQG
jgi:hypothetical protein